MLKYRAEITNTEKLGEHLTMLIQILTAIMEMPNNYKAYLEAYRNLDIGHMERYHLFNIENVEKMINWHIRPYERLIYRLETNGWKFSVKNTIDLYGMLPKNQTNLNDNSMVLFKLLTTPSQELLNSQQEPAPSCDLKSDRHECPLSNTICFDNENCLWKFLPYFFEFAETYLAKRDKDDL